MTEHGAEMEPKSFQNQQNWKLKSDAKIDPKFWLQKSIKIEPLRAQGPPRAPEAVADVHALGVEGPSAGPKYQRLLINRFKNNRSALSDTPWADGPANFQMVDFIIW